MQPASLKSDRSKRHVHLPWPLDRFLAKQGHPVPCKDDRRRFARLYYRRPLVLELDTSLQAFIRPHERIDTYSCDLSRDGMAFLSPCELYPRETVTLAFSASDRATWMVVRCRRLGPECFEVGARASEPS